MQSVKPNIQTFADPEHLAQAAAARFVQLAQEAIAVQGLFTVVLSGGSTPKRLYQLLATPQWCNQVSWNKVHLFWGDERHVPPDHPDSNYRMVRENLIDRVPIPTTNIHRIRSENPDAAQAANHYEQELRLFFELTKNELPQFDVVFLGMGSDGHTASLFPGTGAIFEQKQLVVAPWVEKFKSDRITLTPPVINNAVQIIFFVTGTEKAATLKAVLEGQYQPDRYPSQIIHSTAGVLTWMVDQPASSLLSTAVAIKS
jgi:6-phosphogluconolactonase